MSDTGTLDQVRELGLSYITGLPAATQIALLVHVQEESPELFDQTLSEFDQDGRRFILCRHNQKGYQRGQQNHRNLRKACQGLKKIQASPQNYNKEKLFHRAMNQNPGFIFTHSSNSLFSYRVANSSRGPASNRSNGRPESTAFLACSRALSAGNLNNRFSVRIVLSDGNFAWSVAISVGQ